VRVGAAPAPQPPGLAFWSDIGSLRSPPSRRETSSLVDVRTGGAGGMVRSAWACHRAWPAICLQCRYFAIIARMTAALRTKPVSATIREMSGPSNRMHHLFAFVGGSFPPCLSSAHALVRGSRHADRTACLPALFGTVRHYHVVAEPPYRAREAPPSRRQIEPDFCCQARAAS
jgi:hypothetical protein